MEKPVARVQQARFLVAGLLPVILFTIIEEYYGTLWGLIAGMVFGVGEILWEFYSERKVSAVTWGGNALLILMGGISLLTDSGIWFKLQPAILEAVFAVVLWGAWVLDRPLLLMLSLKNLPSPNGQPLQPELVHPHLKSAFSGLTLRLGLFFAIHAALATWAALKWSTSAWAALKGIGLTVSLLVYMVIEALVLRVRVRSGH